jgi:drug/metabolite transporter (DMT)-like permease
MIRLLVVSLLWAFSFGLIKTQLMGVDSSLVAAARLSLALLVFLPFLRIRSVAAGTAAPLLLIGAIQFGLMYLGYLKAFQTLAAYQVALLTIVTPIMVCLVDDALERRFRWQPLFAAALAVVGTGVIVVRQPLGRAAWLGLLLVQVSNLCFALGQVLYRRWKLARPHVHDRDVFAWLYLGAAAVTLPFAGTPSTMAIKLVALAPVQGAVLIYLGFVASGLAFFLWNRGAQQVSTASLAVMNNAKTPLGVAVSLLVFGEKTDLLRLLLGGGLVVAAAVYAQRIEPPPSRS